MPKAATLKDLAQRTGVSLSAVSMALKDHPRIGAETKQRVLQAAQELGYVANAAGRALQGQRVGAVALVVPNTSQHVFGHQYFMHVLVGVNEVVVEYDKQLLLSTNTDADCEQLESAYSRVLRAGWVDGALITSARMNDPGIRSAVDSGLPVVLLGNFPDIPHAASVGVDDAEASYQATIHMLDEHKCVAPIHIAGPLEHRSALDRRDGFIAACTQRNINPQILEGDYSEQSGRNVADEVIRRGCDSVVVANDEMAYGLIQELKNRGVHVPDALKVIGFDDFGLSAVTTPSISTMHVPVVKMAHLATEMLLNIIDGHENEPNVRTLPVDFVPRQSCGCQELS